MRPMSARSRGWGQRIECVLPALFWFALLAVVLVETLLITISTPRTTNAASRQDDDLSAMWLDGSGASNAGAEAVPAKLPQKL